MYSCSKPDHFLLVALSLGHGDLLLDLKLMLNLVLKMLESSTVEVEMGGGLPMSEAVLMMPGSSTSDIGEGGRLDGAVDGA